MSWRNVENERGVALIAVLLVTLALVAISAGALVLTSQTSLVNKYHQRQSLLETAADAGLEEARSRINGKASTLYPDTGFNTLETDAPVYDAGGAVIPGLKRSLYVGPIGISSGQYGVFGSAVTVVRDQSGNTVVRRLEVVQESFAKFAYFTNVEGSINFSNGDQIFGPVHSNDEIEVNSSGATFHGPVSTAQQIVGKSYATFKQGYNEHVSPIPMPSTAALTKLQAQALAGGMAFVSNTNGTPGQAEMRIEFVAIDLNGDGLTNGDNEGFIKVFQHADESYVSASRPTVGSSTLYLRNENNCGHAHAAAGGTFVTAGYAPGLTSGALGHPLEPNGDSWSDALTTSANRRCYLGGDSLLTNRSNAGFLAWTGVVSPLVAGRYDAQYLFPISRELNPTFKGVIYVAGKVLISGKLRGRVTLAASNNIIIGDDVTYVTNPAAGTCVDMLGLFSATDVVVSDNMINGPTRVIDDGSGTYYTLDNDAHEFFHGVILALSNLLVENHSAGPNNSATGRENCETTAWGRGCLYLTGGIIQETRGAVGTTGGTGHLKRYSYDACAFSSPPPYFPTTGHFAKGHYFEIDPTGFNIMTYFNLLAAGT